MIPSSIRLRLTFSFGLVIGLLLAVTGYLLYLNAYENRIAHIDGALRVILSDLAMDAQEVQGNFDAQELAGDLQDLRKKFGIGNLRVRVLRENTQSNEIEKVAELEWGDAPSLMLSDSLRGLEDEVAYLSWEDFRIATLAVEIDDAPMLFLQAATKLTELGESLRETLLILIAVNFSLWIVSVLGAYVLLGRILASVHQVIESVNQIEAHDYHRRIGLDKVPHEIRELVQTFNELLSRHEESYRKISDFSADASHELNTPLTVIRGEIEVGLRRKRTDEEYRSILQRVLSEMIKIQNLVQDLLLLSKTDKLQTVEAFEEVYLDEIVEQSVRAMIPLAQKKEMIIKIEQIEPYTVDGHAMLLETALKNLMKNAIHYSPEKTTVKISLSSNAEGCMITIEDQGMGMSAEQKKRAFDRFYRADHSAAFEREGSGLGLSIVAMIVDIHGFGIELDSVEKMGTTVKINIPAFRKQQP